MLFVWDADDGSSDDGGLTFRASCGKLGQSGPFRDQDAKPPVRGRPAA